MFRCAAGRDELENRSLTSAPPRTAPAPATPVHNLRTCMLQAGRQGISTVNKHAATRIGDEETNSPAYRVAF